MTKKELAKMFNRVFKPIRDGLEEWFEDVEYSLEIRENLIDEKWGVYLLEDGKPLKDSISLYRGDEEIFLNPLRFGVVENLNSEELAIEWGKWILEELEEEIARKMERLEVA